MSLSFTVLGRPEPQGSMRGFIQTARNGAQTARLTSANSKMRPWRQEVGWEALRSRIAAGIDTPWDSSVAVKMTVLFVFVKPPSVKKSRIFPTVKPDLDKLLRAILDACTGVIWRDDGQVVEIVSQKRYGLPESAEIKLEALNAK